MNDTMPQDGSGATHLVSASDREAVRRVLESAWVDAGYTAPNTRVYPWQWLWDSCFHALVWLELGETDRELVKLQSALRLQDDSGFVPHMGYQLDPIRPVELWGRRGASSITQPPMYGHAVATLLRRGVEVPEELVARAEAGLAFLLQRRARDEDGLLRVVNPWETGCDDSPRWDDYCPGGYALERWRPHKVDLLATIVTGPAGEPLDNPAFTAAPAGFNALVAWNTRELVGVGAAIGLRSMADEVAEALDRRWNPERGTWVDAGPATEGSGRIRTADGLLGLLTTTDPDARRAVVRQLEDHDQFGSEHGPRGVHRGESCYDADTYWRGPVWPQLAYLLWSALDSGDVAEGRAAASLARRTIIGAQRSGLAEYWNPDTGEGRGAIPQSWTGLMLLMDPTPTS